MAAHEEIDSAPRYVDVREEDEYITDEPRQNTLEEVRQRYKFTDEFLSQQLQCSHCGSAYRPKDNFGGFFCRFHPGSLRYDSETSEFYYDCCRESPQTVHLTIGCKPCIHSSRKIDFTDIVLAQKGFKYLPVDIVDILKSFPIDRSMIVGVDYKQAKYLFATSEPQLLREKALALPGRSLVDEDPEDDYGGADQFALDDDDDEALLNSHANSIVVADDNWKIKLYIH